MLVRVKRSQGGSESPEEGRKPEELSGNAFKQVRRASLGRQGLGQQATEPGKLGRVETDTEMGEV